MEDSEDQKMKAFVAELIDALEEELELENPFIPEDEKKLFVKYMINDIFHRKEYKSQLDFAKMDSFTMEKLTKGIVLQNNILH